MAAAGLGPVEDLRALPEQVRHYREQALALLGEFDPATAERIIARHSVPEVPAIVVVGETKRGKSSLVNALLNCQGLSPVDARPATSTFLVFRHAETWSARACRPGRSPEPVEIAELARWTSAAAEPPAGQMSPHHVEVTGPVPLLRRVSVVDSPGVGGLAEPCADLALDAVAQASALLFVLDASAPLTDSELRFLRRVGDEVETVLFALTKIDQSRGWREVLAADRGALAEHAPRFADAPIHPVSARLVAQATTVADPAVATLLREQSGIATLQTAIQERLVGRSVLLTEANTVRALGAAFDGLTVALDAQARALSSGPDEAAARARRRDELIGQRRSASRGWQLRLRSEISKARLDVGHEVAKQIRDLTAWCRREIDGASRDALSTVPPQVDAGVQVVSQRVGALLAARLTAIAEQSLAEVFSAAELTMLRARFGDAGPAPVPVRAPDRRPATAEDTLLVFMGLSSGLGIGRAAAMPLAGLGATAALTPVLLPLTIVVGLGAGWWVARTRRHTQDKAHLKQWLTDALAEGRSTIDQLVAERLIEAEQQLSLALDDAITRRISAITDELRQIDAALALDAAERAKQVREIERRGAQVSATARRGAELLGHLRTGADSASAADSTR